MKLCGYFKYARSVGDREVNRTAVERYALCGAVFKTDGERCDLAHCGDSRIGLLIASVLSLRSSRKRSRSHADIKRKRSFTAVLQGYHGIGSAAVHIVKRISVVLDEYKLAVGSGVNAEDIVLGDHLPAAPSLR